MATNLKRYSAFHHVDNTELLKQASKVTGVGVGGLLEMLVLGMSDDELKTAVERGKERRRVMPDGRSTRGEVMRKMMHLSAKQIEDLLKLVDEKGKDKAA